MRSPIRRRSKVLIRLEDQRDLLIYAFRYCLGRRTYATHTMQQALKQAWPNLSAGDRAMYKREIREAQENMHLGDDCDAQGWLEVLTWED